MTVLSALYSLIRTVASSVRRLIGAAFDFLFTGESPTAPTNRAATVERQDARPLVVRGNATQKDRIGTVPDEVCVYAIGDIHGRLDLLQDLIGKIQSDAETLPVGTRVQLVFLGDYIDRGLNSKQVIDFLIGGQLDPFERVYLMGNHEEALLRFMEDASFGQTWANYGGIETLYSYGFQGPRQMLLGERSNDQSLDEAWNELWDRFRSSIPADHLTFYRQLVPYHVVGDYVFVHAGLKPGVPIQEQTSRDLFWIRDEFLRDTQPFEKIVVHGHTPADQIFHDHRRIGLDTGAYITGRLSAGRFFASTVQFIST